MNTNEFIRKEDGKIVIPVPEKIRYMSEWTDFNLNFFGNQPFIIDKQIPGCGFTEYCLTNNEDLVLTSPRKMLLKNKENQHHGEIYYFENSCDRSYAVDKDLNKKGGEKESERAENHEDLTDMKLGLLQYISRRRGEYKPVKIIVTYDSFKHVKRFLKEFEKKSDGKGEKFSDYKIIVDEFQSIFVDSRFKATTEFSFLNELRDLQNQICFVSATPMMDRYLIRLDYFKGLPYYELNWGIKDQRRVMKPELKVRKTQSINSELKRIIREYKEYVDGSRIPEHLANPITGEIVYSREAVFYVNSVNNILSIIKSEGLKPEDVNILCSDTPDNTTKIKKRLGAKYSIGSVPLKGQPHKMFTFCTRTVYLGADFYSLCARTFILSDANVDSLAVDISLDLPQILGRQRLIENPWKNHAEFYFKNLGIGKNESKEVFNKFVEKKKEASTNVLSLFDKASSEEKESYVGKLRSALVVEKYTKDYISVNFSGSNYYPIFNDLVLIAEERAFDIQQIDYKDRFTVFNIIKSNNFRLDEIGHYVEYLRNPKNGHISDRLKELCEIDEYTDEEKSLIAQQVSEKFDQYYNLVGPKRCAQLGYNVTYIKQEVDRLKISEEDIQAKFIGSFNVGDKYPNTKLKELVGNIYKELGLNLLPKARDLDKYFQIKKTKVKDSSNTFVNGLEIIGIK